MIKERRRYFRQPVKMLVKMVYEGKTLNATSTNISEGGLALMLREAPPKGASPHLRFTLPSSSIHIDVAAEVAWVDVKGLAGFRFQNLAEDSKQALEKWLDDQLEQEFPGTKERLAAAESQTPH
jgi:c-di-GMP-binding flagellar brake protein YcgR